MKKLIKYIGKGIKYQNKIGKIYRILKERKNIKIDIKIQEENNYFILQETPVILDNKEFYTRIVKLYEEEKAIILLEGNYDVGEKIILWGSIYTVYKGKG